MSKILEKALQQAKGLPDSRQTEIGEMIIHVVEQDQSDGQLSLTQAEEVRRRMSASNPLFATDDQVVAFFHKFAV